MTNLPVVPATDDWSTGLEDFDQSDMVMPMLKIVHDKGVYADSLSGELHDQLRTVILGLVKQRILWPPEMSEGGKAQPLCRSLNFHVGLPPEPRDFPWKAAGLTAKDHPTGELPCASCNLKEWGSHPKNDTPWCTEQWQLVLLTLEDDGVYAPAILTLQRSSLRNARAYMTAFASKQQRIYSAHTTLSLQQNRRGSVNYSVAQFAKGEATDRDLWPEWTANYERIREFLQTPRAAEGDEPRATTARSAAAIDDDDEIDFDE